MRRWADRLAPVPVIESYGVAAPVEPEAGPVVPGFQIMRVNGSRRLRVLGPCGGAQARDAFLAMKQDANGDAVVLIHDGQVRDYWPRTPKAFADIRKHYPRAT